MKPLSLKARAVNYLSKREYSRAELTQKLARPTLASLRAAADNPHLDVTPPTENEIDAVLDDLERQGFLNDTRFAQNFVHRQAKKQGTARLLHQLSTHKLNPELQTHLAQELKNTELTRCYAIWQQRFGHIDLNALAPNDLLASKAKQTRFLLQRGFDHQAVRKVLQGWTPENYLD